MTTDTRCCGTGTCLINADGLCWCGTRWNGDEMLPPDFESNQLQAPVDKGLEAAKIAANPTPEMPSDRPRR